MEIHIHGSSRRHNYLDLDPYTDAYGLPLLRMTFDWNDNGLRMMNYVDPPTVPCGTSPCAARHRRGQGDRA
jgi:hypothetical protein